MDMIMGYLQSGVSAIIPLVILLGILVFVHELGHFLVARWCGVRVEVFSLGFGKKLVQYKHGDTNYCISLIPLGGYVKMYGEQPGDSISEEDKKHSFTHKNVWQRIAVVLAGPMMNFFFAILVFVIVAFVGEDMRSPVIGDVHPKSPAYEAGLRTGDKVLRVGDQPVRTWDEFQDQLTKHIGQDVTLEIAEYRIQDKTKSIKVPVVSKSNPNILSTQERVGDIEGIGFFAKGTAIAVRPDSPMKAMGLQTGDFISSVNGRKSDKWRDLEDFISAVPADQNLELGIQRLFTGNGKIQDQMQDITISMKAGVVKSYSLQNLGLESADTYLGKVMDDSPAKAAGLQAGDKITHIDGKAMLVWDDVLQSIRNWKGGEFIKIEVDREGKALSFNVTPKVSEMQTPQGLEEKRYAIGIQPVINATASETTRVKADSLSGALSRGVVRTWDVTVMTVMSFVRLFEAKVSPKNIGGVISIGQAAHDTFKMGLSQFLTMMAIISVNLFVLNLLPVPVLDGGHLVFYAVEVIKGSPLSLKKMEIAQQIGIILLMSLMAFALFNDFTRLFSS